MMEADGEDMNGADKVCPSSSDAEASGAETAAIHSLASDQATAAPHQTRLRAREQREVEFDTRR